MDDITAPTISLKRAASAAGLDLRFLRQTLAECRVLMLGQPTRRAGSWNRGSAMDVYRLLVLRKAMDCGFSLAEAVQILDLGVDPFLGGLAGCGLPVPGSVLLTRLAGQMLHVTRDDDELDVFFTPGVGSSPSGDVTVSFDLGLLAADAIRLLQEPL